MKMITLKCSYCDKSFERRLSMYNHQNVKMKHKVFCGHSCSRKYYNPLRDTFNYEHLLLHAGNRWEELSPFKYFITKCRERKRQKEDNFDIDLYYLKNLWEKQNGICPYTKIKMILPKSTLSHSKLYSLKKASLDRIDSSKGYIKGNVEFVCLFINLAKNSHSKNEVINFIEEIKNGDSTGIRTQN